MASGLNFTTTVYPIDRDGAEHEIDVRVHYDCDCTPAFVSGLPENCYTAGGYMAITNIEIIGELPRGISDSDVHEAAHKASDRITQHAWNDYFSFGVDDRG